jgi:membrane-bound lytic murein transglycosylase B
MVQLDMAFAVLRRPCAAIGLAAVLVVAALASAHAAGFPLPDPKGFAAWRADFRARAIQSGLAPSAVDAILGGTKFLPEVVAADRTQPEGKQPLADYIAEVATPKTIADGRAAYARNRAVFAAVLTKYDVDAWPIVGIWANESRYGKLIRPYPIASSLATMSYDLRRRSYFENELRSYIRMQQMGVPNLPSMTGSWAGALGQPQFEPSDYLDYAVDFDGDGRKDIWGSDADVIGSVANFLHRHGWHQGLPWGSEVKAAPDFIAAHNLSRTEKTACRFADELSERRTVDQWRALGVGGIDPRLKGDLETSFLSFKLAQGRQFLVSRNFETILTYNCSLHYALTASLVSDRVLP